MQTQPQKLKVRVQLVRERTRKAEPTNIRSPQEAAKALAHLARLDREHLVAMHMNTRNDIIAMETVSIGSLTASIVHPREIFKAAILSNAASILLAHNHPSGEALPSTEDKQATVRMAKAGSLLGIPLMDHIIIAGEGYYSFKEHGRLSGSTAWRDW